MIGQSALLLAAASGALALAGLVLVVMGSTKAPVRLVDAFRRLDGLDVDSLDLEIPADGTEHVGLWVARVLHLPLLPGQARLLALKGKTVADLMGEKIVFAMIGLVSPAILATSVALIGGVGLWVPAVVAPVGMIVGFFVPDLLLATEGATSREEAGEALFTFFDLVTLERLANRSAPQALAAAAELSDAPLFRLIRESLDRARLEQRSPYGELTRLAEELALSELADIADVMRLDETGAALSDVLRARVKELRDAHLTRAKIDAHATSERMTVWMVLPAMVFGLIFLVPPLLRLLT